MTIRRRDLFHIRPRRQEFDAIVVGSGMSGGWAAKELTELGANVLVLEAGPMIVPERDYAEHLPPYEMPYRGWNDRKALAAEQPIQRQCYACDEVARKFFVNDNEHPYTTDPDSPFLWIRGRQVGGRSIMWARQCYRLSDLDFEANARDGNGVDWPIRYADLAPWYDHVEAFVGISGQAEGLAHLPDGVFQPPMQMSCVEEHLRDTIAAAFGGRRRMTIGRTAVLTRDHRGRQACHYCGPCHRGCRTRSYFSSLNATLPAAEATGRMTLRPNSIVPEVLWDARAGRVTGVRVIDRESGEDTIVRGRVVFLAASALESTRILLNSKSAAFPDGLANSSGVLGKYLMDHMMCDDTRAVFDGWEDRTTRGRRPNGIYIARFRNVTEPASDFVRGYGFQGSAVRTGWGRGISMAGFGAGFKRELLRPGPWEFRLHAFGECLPREENQVTLDPAQVDAWGIPTLRIQCAWGENERVMMRDAVEEAGAMLDAAGGRNIVLQREMAPPGLAIHEMGTARMGRDPESSVLNAHSQAWDAPNLFVVDGAAMTSAGCQNPSLTYMALAARASHYAVWAARRGEV